MDNFLNSEEFCKMAREYNEKYNTVESLSVGNNKQLAKVLVDLEKICNILRKTFEKKVKFNLAKEKIDVLEREILDIQRDCGIESYSQNKIYFFSYKRVAVDILRVLNNLFLLKNEDNGKKVEILQKKFYDLIFTVLAVF